ncbi:hypothetical protein D3C73_1408550 [compost metagenome]
MDKTDLGKLILVFNNFKRLDNFTRYACFLDYFPQCGFLNRLARLHLSLGESDFSVPVLDELYLKASLEHPVHDAASGYFPHSVIHPLTASIGYDARTQNNKDSIPCTGDEIL